MGSVELELWLILGLVGAAFVAGWVDAVVGGGGLIQLPALLIGLPESTPVGAISGTNKVSSAAGTLVASLTYLRRVAVPWRSAAVMLACAFAGSALGAQLVQYLPKRWFTPLVLVVLLGVGWYTVRRPQLGLHHSPRPMDRTAMALIGGIGLVVGLYDGFLGPGTGSFFVIALVGLMGFGFLQASVLAKLANLTTNLAAVLVFGVSGVIVWKLALPMAAANLCGGFLGARMALRHGSGFVRRVFLVVIGVLSVRLAWQTIAAFMG